MELGGTCRLHHVELRGTGTIQLGLQGVGEVLGRAVNDAEKGKSE